MDLLPELLILTEEMAKRRGSDPLLEYRPSERQEAFVRSVLTEQVNENWLIAANRAGKSDAGAYCGATLARWGNDNARYVAAKGSRIEVKDRATAGWVVGLDFPILRDTIQPKYFDNGFVPPGGREPFIPLREIEEWRTTDQVLRLKNGSIIGFKSVDSGRTKFQSAERDWVHFDEEPPEDIYQETTIRVGTRALRIFGTVTLLPPQGQVGGVSWMFPKIIQPWQDGKLPDVALFKASIYDNPYIPVAEIRRLEARYPPGSVERRIRLEGEWLPGLAGARAYPAFNRLVNVRAQEAPNPHRPVCWMMDFNVEPMVSLVGYRGPDRIFRIWRELILEQGDLYSMVQLFHEILPTHGAELWIYGDATSRSRSRQTGQSDYQLIMNMMRSYGVPIRLKVPESNPAVPDRINAVQRACRDEDGVIRVEVDPGCVELIADLEQVLRDPNGGIKKSRNAKDAYYRRTHTSDAFGYWVAYEEPVRSSRIGETRRVSIPMPSYSLQKLGVGRR